MKKKPRRRLWSHLPEPVRAAFEHRKGEDEFTRQLRIAQAFDDASEQRPTNTPGEGTPEAQRKARRERAIASAKAYQHPIREALGRQIETAIVQTELAAGIESAYEHSRMEDKLAKRREKIDAALTATKVMRVAGRVIEAKRKRALQEGSKRAVQKERERVHNRQSAAGRGGKGVRRANSLSQRIRDENVRTVDEARTKLPALYNRYVKGRTAKAIAAGKAKLAKLIYSAHRAQE